MSKIGIYGGSFNPVHFGHLGLADWIVRHTDIDEIWMMVSPNNPLKKQSDLEDEHIRLERLSQAIQEKLPETCSRIKACEFEFSLPRPSYTANTLRELKKTYPEHEFVLIIGEDNWKIFDRWREWEYILSNYEIIVYPRKAKTTEGEAAVAPTEHVHFICDAPLFDISSTEIRQQRAQQHTTL